MNTCEAVNGHLLMVWDIEEFRLSRSPASLFYRICSGRGGCLHNFSNGAGCSYVRGGGHWLHKRNYERPQRVYDRLEHVYAALEND
jgi:hypothetical protein